MRWQEKELRMQVLDIVFMMGVSHQANMQKNYFCILAWLVEMK